MSSFNNQNEEDSRDENLPEEVNTIFPPRDVIIEYIDDISRNPINNASIKAMRSTNTYNSDISTEQTIYTFSDVHADIQALIISLRDCAGVIRKRAGLELSNLEEIASREKYLPHITDRYLEDMLNLDICYADNGYDETLGYEWIGTNNIVVIIGDIIDGSRGMELIQIQNRKDNKPDKIINGHPTTMHDYPQLEIKLLRFINSINQMAELAGGNIKKLLGNHEIANFSMESIYKDQTFIRLIKDTNYYVNRKTGLMENRRESFLYGGSGYELVMDGGSGILLKINNYIFVHASIQQVPFNLVKQINNIINDPNQPFENHLNIYNRFSGGYNRSMNSDLKKMDNLLWDTIYGDPIPINNPRGFNCNKVKDDLRYFFSENQEYITPEYINQIKIFVGHCIQYKYKHIIYGIETFTTIDNTNTNPNVEELIGPATEGPQDVIRNRLYGISMGCPSDYTRQNHQVYKVDIGSSRAQDQFFLERVEKNLKITDINNNYDEKLKLLSRTPQVLKISPTKISIIRSIMKNTRIYQPRPIYEDHANTKPRPDVDPNTINYLTKYLKYKNKYLSLKLQFKR